MSERAKLWTARTGDRVGLAISMLVVITGVVWIFAGSRSGARSDPAVPRPLDMAYDETTGRLEHVSYDRNADGRPDAWLTMDGTRLRLAELDEDYDQRIDRWEHYEGESADGADDPPVLVEISTRDDGRISRWERYSNGRLFTVEEDSDGNERVDKWERYQNGALAVLELDEHGEGRPTRRLRYGPRGDFLGVDVDPDGDGEYQPVELPEHRDRM